MTTSLSSPRVFAAAALLILAGSTLGGQSGAPVELMTVTIGGMAGGGESFLDGSQLYGTGLTNISADNRFVVFSSASPDLVPGDTNGVQDVFVRDRSSGVTRLVSIGSTGAQGNRPSGEPVISADGRYVAFVSLATNLVPGDTNQLIDPGLGTPNPNSGYDVFVRDLQAQTTVRVSVASGGAQAEYGVINMAPAISADGRYIAFASLSRNLVIGDTNRFNVDIFVHDRITGLTERASLRPDGSEIVGADSFQPSISGDGRRVAFTVADNTLAGPTPQVPPNLAKGVYVRDLNLGQTILVSAMPDGSPAATLFSDYPMISANGRYVSFASWDDLDPSQPDYAQEVLLDGPFADVFVRDLLTNTTRRASVPFPGGPAEESGHVSAISGDGRFVVYTNAQDMVVRDMIANTSAVIRPPDGSSPSTYNVTISQDGRYAFFESFTDQLVPNDTNGLVDAFLIALPPAAGADLSLTLGASTTKPAPNTDVTFTIGVTNGGSQNASGISVAVPLPPGLTYVSDTGGGAYAGGTWTIPALASGSTATLQLVARVDTLSPVTVVAEIMTATPFDPDSTPGNGSVTEDDYKRVVITPQAIDLALSLNANTVTPAVNSNVTLTSSLSNTGNISATGVAVRIVLPAGLRFISDSGGAAYDSVTGLWSPGVISAGGFATLRVVARVTTASPVDLSTEVVAANEADRDSTPNNNVAGEDDQAAVHLDPVRTDIVVNDTTGVVNANDGKCTLVEAIIAANTDAPSGNALGECAGGSGADVIHLRALTPVYSFAAAHNSVDGFNALPSVTSDITIDAGGQTIERVGPVGPPFFRLFHVQAAGRLALDKAVVRNGYASVPGWGTVGGAVLNFGTLVVMGGVMTGNRADCDGGAIYSAGPLTVNGTSIHDNISMLCSGGGIATGDARTVSVVGAMIRANKAARSGGGLFVGGMTAATMESTVVQANTATLEGGGIATHGGDANLSITRSVITSNVSAAGGGGIANGRFSDFGEVLIAGGMMSISLTVITGNSAATLGGGIANAGSLFVYGSSIALNRVAGKSPICGGGVFSAGPLSLLVTETSNNRSINGGGVCATGQILTIVGGRIAGNEASGVGGGTGGGVLVDALGKAPGTRNVVIANVTIEKNIADSNGGGVLAQLQTADALTVDHATIRQNRASWGAGLYIFGGTATLRNDTRMLENVAVWGGGGLIFDDGLGPATLVMEGGVVDGNVANGFWGNTGGGGIWNSADRAGSAMTLNGVTLKYNRASTSWGGAIRNKGNLNISGAWLVANDAENGGGGGIYTEYSTRISGSTFSENRGVIGAGLMVVGGTTEVINSTVTANYGAFLGGGAIDVSGALDSSGNINGRIKLTRTTIAGNVGNPGGVKNGGVVEIFESILAGNRRPDGTYSECARAAPAIPPFFTPSFRFRGNITGQDSGCPLSVENYLYDLRTIDPATVFTTLLEILAFNGGPTPTHKLRPGSLAIDASPANCEIDQRGLPAPVDGDGDGIAACDVGAFEQQSVSPSPTPTLTSVSPATARSGAVPSFILITGTGFTANAIARWNGAPRVTFAETPTRLRVQLLPADRTTTGDIVTASITVTNPSTGPSNVLPFTIVSNRVSTVRSIAVAPGATATVAGVGVNATLTNNDPASPPATVTVATYSKNPARGNLFAAGGFFDVQVTGADASDSVTANFYYPFTVTGAVEAALQLLYWTGTVWAPVIGSGGAPPIKNTTDNPDGVNAGGRFTVTFDSTSTPSIIDLTGTAFALAKCHARPSHPRPHDQRDKKRRATHYVCDHHQPR